MTGKTASILRFGIAMLSLAAAIAVYLLARAFPPELLAAWRSTGPALAGHAEIFGSAPSLFYTLALGLLLGACASSLARARLHCLAWTGLASILEISQRPEIAKPLSALLHNHLSASAWHVVGPYWTRGIFDPLDLLATLVGGAIALLLLGHLSNEKSGPMVS